MTLQEVSPFVLQQGFALEVTTFGSLGLLIGIAYFAGAMTVNRRVAQVGGRQLMRQGPRSYCWRPAACCCSGHWAPCRAAVDWWP